MNVAFDTNVMVYGAGVNTPERREAVSGLLTALGPSILFAPAQALGELFNVLTRKARWSSADARVEVQRWRTFTYLVATTDTAFAAAVDLATDHRLTIWDAIILAVTAEADCRVLLSEDMQHGFTWHGLTVVNPFVEPVHPLLAEAIGS